MTLWRQPHQLDASSKKSLVLLEMESQNSQRVSIYRLFTLHAMNNWICVECLIVPHMKRLEKNEEIRNRLLTEKLQEKNGRKLNEVV